MAVLEVLARARAAVDELTAALEAEHASIDGDVVDALVPAVWELSDRVALAATTVVGEWDSRGRFGLDGSRSAGRRLARDVGCSPATAGRVLRRARFLRRFPDSGRAVASRAVSPDKADVLARAVIPARRDLYNDAETELLTNAQKLGYDDFSRTMTYWADCADDHLGRDRSKGQHDQRRLHIARTLDGSWNLQARLDPISGAIVASELDRITQILFDDDWALARDRYGPDATADDLVRTAAQRRADALMIMATRSTATPEGSQPARPLFTAMTDPSTMGRICELADGTPLTPGALAPWITAADVERAIFDPKSRVIDLGRRTRFFRGGLRRAIELRDRHCTFPGCKVPAEYCDVDHIIEYCDGGPTTQANGRLRCPTHNRQRPGRKPRNHHRTPNHDNDNDDEDD